MSHGSPGCFINSQVTLLPSCLDPSCHITQIKCEQYIHYASSWDTDKVTLLLLPHMTTVHCFQCYAWNPALLLLLLLKSTRLFLWFPEVILKSLHTHPFLWSWAVSNMGCLLEGLFLCIPKTSTPQDTREALRSMQMWGPEPSPQICAALSPCFKSTPAQTRSLTKRLSPNGTFSFSPLTLNTSSHPNSSKAFTLHLACFLAELLPFHLPPTKDRQQESETKISLHTSVCVSKQEWFNICIWVKGDFTASPKKMSSYLSSVYSFVANSPSPNFAQRNNIWWNELWIFLAN